MVVVVELAEKYILSKWGIQLFVTFFLLSLAGLYSASSSGKNKKNKMNNRENIVENRFVFYLDGFEGESTKVLRLAGYSDAELYSANMFEDTAKQLKVSLAQGWALFLPTH